MSATTAQRLIAAIFLLLGLWCLVLPRSVIALSLLSGVAAGSRAETLLMACFGAQAMLAGLFAATARFTAATFLAYGMTLLLFFGFDYWFWQVDPLFNATILIDAVGNAVMLALCVVGWKKLAKLSAR